MDFDLGYDETDPRPAPDDVELPRNPVSKQNNEILEQYAPIYQEDYYDFKESLMKWLLVKGKSPQKQEGYATSTVCTTHYKIEETYRWVWSENGEYTKEFSPEDATEFLEYLRLHAGKNDNYLDRVYKSIKRLFNYWRDSENKRIEKWDPDLDITPNYGDTEKKGHDRFRPHEFSKLYNAAVGLKAVKAYDTKSMSPDERDRIKRLLAQRFEKPKSEIGPEDFDRANSWKIPSMISVTLDTGLRPIEVGRAKVSWFDLDNGEMHVPKEDATKNDDSWQCGLTDSTVNALFKWLKERETYEKYHSRDGVWLTKYGNPYSSQPLNRILRELIEASDIDEGNRDLTWYSIRHGVATLWAEEKGIYKAKKQLRHKDIETTLGYTHNSGSTLRRDANDLW